MKLNPPHSDEPLARRGVTLVEMMVVVSILLILFAVAIPKLRPSIEQTRLREGARLAKAALARARMRTLETGNPVGLVIEESVVDGRACFSLGFAQIPTLFGGSSALSSDISIASDGTTTFGVPADAGEINVGDSIKFNYQGKKYRVAQQGASGTEWKFTDEGNNVDLVLNNAKFQVFKPPFRSTQTTPTPLPKNVCVDIVASGLGNDSFGAAKQIIILFNTAGLVEQVYVDGQATTPTSPIYLLIGDTATLGAADLGEYWIACGHQTGSIITADVADNANDLVVARTFAREKKVKGGR